MLWPHVKRHQREAFTVEHAVVEQDDVVVFILKHAGRFGIANVERKDIITVLNLEIEYLRMWHCAATHRGRTGLSGRSVGRGRTSINAGNDPAALGNGSEPNTPFFPTASQRPGLRPAY